MSENPEPAPKTYRVLIVHQSGHVTLLEDGVLKERAEQIRVALAGLFPDVKIEEKHGS